MLSKNFLWGAIGIILGIIINNSVVLLSALLKIKILLLQNIIQLTLCSFILALIQYFFNYFGWTWQNVTPGLFFVSFFFGIQFNIFTNIQTAYISK
jgi:hypothetical protein